MIDDISKEAKDQMESSIEALRKGLSTIRAGRANAAMLDGVQVDYYGSKTPLSQVASVTTPDASLIVVKPWEKNLLGDIEKAIFEANLGITPTNDGEVVRVPLPPMSEERRKDFVKQAKSKSEDAKISVRNARRDANDMLKAAKKDGDISEDDEKRGTKAIQDLTDKYVAMCDELFTNKEKEILEV